MNKHEGDHKNEHKDEHKDEHEDVQMVVVLDCQKSIKGQKIPLTLFSRYKNIKKIELSQVYTVNKKQERPKKKN